MEKRIDEVESIVEQLNDTSTQPAAKPSTTTTEVKQLKDKIQAVEK